MPSHLGLSGKNAEGAVSLNEESAASFRGSYRGVMDGLFVEIAVRGGTENVAACRQWLSTLFRTISGRRCFSSQ
jgi:hypothetical protein